MRSFLLSFAPAALFCACSSQSVPETRESPPPSPPGMTATWRAGDERSFGALAAASAGDEGAVAYAELEAPTDGRFTRTRIKLQRIDSAGAARGTAIELGVVDAALYSGLTLASDGDRYLACWSNESRIDCAAAPISEGDATRALSIAGAWPCLAYGSGTFALAHSVPGQLAVVRVAGDGSVVGSPAMFESADDPYSSHAPLTLLAATGTGFVLLGGTSVRAHTLDASLSPIAAPVDLGVRSWVYGSTAASGTKVAINLSAPYGSNLFVLEGGTLTQKQPIDGGGKLGLRVDLADEGSSFGMLLAKVERHRTGPGLVYRTLAGSERAQDAELEVANEAPRAVAASLEKDVVVVRVQRP